VLGGAARAGVSSDVSGLGGALLALVVRARAEGVDPEQALRETVRELIADVRAAEPGGR
jgi:XTP/dITP diphosphohydrolase